MFIIFFKQGKSIQFYSDACFLTYKLLIAVGFKTCLRKHLELIQSDQPGFET